MMHAFLVSATLVALAEMGDKTQLLSLVLAARFRRPWPIVLGVLTATLANHALAASIGAWLTHVVGPQTMRYVVAVGFLGMAAWTLVPDKPDTVAPPAGLGSTDRLLERSAVNHEEDAGWLIFAEAAASPGLGDRAGQWGATPRR